MSAAGNYTGSLRRSRELLDALIATATDNGLMDALKPCLDAMEAAFATELLRLAESEEDADTCDAERFKTDTLGPGPNFDMAAWWGNQLSGDGFRCPDGEKLQVEYDGSGKPLLWEKGMVLAEGWSKITSHGAVFYKHTSGRIEATKPVEEGLVPIPARWTDGSLCSSMTSPIVANWGAYIRVSAFGAALGLPVWGSNNATVGEMRMEAAREITRRMDAMSKKFLTVTMHLTNAS